MRLGDALPRSYGRLSRLELFAYSASVFIQFSGLVFIPFFLYLNGSSVYTSLMTASATISLSIAWIPAIHKKIKTPSALAYDHIQPAYEPKRPRSARIQAYLYNSLFRMVFTSLFLVVYCNFDSDFTYDCVMLGFQHFTSQSAHIPFIFQIVCSFVGFHAARLACVMTIQQAAFAVPLFMVSPVSLFIAVVWEGLPYFSWVGFTLYFQIL